MPIGDPMGGEVDYQNRGKITRVWITAIPVSNLDDAVEFYDEMLGFPVLLDSRENNWVEFGNDDPLGKIALYVPSVHDKEQPGGDTGIVFETDSIYELHRRLVDDGVRFKIKPRRQKWGGDCPSHCCDASIEMNLWLSSSRQPDELTDPSACSSLRGR
jgi:catechol 2,3-dioxygenase-like lactoylglutathione lyase family enzyme